MLKEGSVYCIEYFEGADARVSYRPVDNAIMARFTAHTKIKEITPIPDSFPVYACNLVPFQILRNRVSERKVLSDTLDLITSVSHLNSVIVKGAPKPIRNIEMTDGRESVEVALWGPHALQFDAEGIQAESRQRPIVLVLLGITANVQQDRLSLQGNTICKWYMNAVLPEVAHLQTSLRSIPHEIKWTGQPPTQQHAASVIIPQICSFNPHDVLGNSYIVDVAIKSLVPNQAWWYLACVACKRAINSHKDTYKCLKCVVTTAEPRYRVTVYGVHPPDINKDDAMAAEFIFFSELGQQLIGCPVQSLIDSIQGSSQFIPPDRTRLYGKQYTLRVSVTRRALQRIQIPYQVDSMTVLLPAPTSTAGDHKVQPQASDAAADSPLMSQQAHASASVLAGYESSVTPEKSDIKTAATD